MNEQISIIISILAAVLTGGILMIFIESQHIANAVIERFHHEMRPFMHCFSNYVKFASMVRGCYVWGDADQLPERMKELKSEIDAISKYGNKIILSGEDYPSDFFNAKDLDSVCNDINNIMLYVDKDRYGFNNINFDTDLVEIYKDQIISALKEISLNYKNTPITQDLLPDVSGEFYVNVYQPKSNVLHQYECWQKKENRFKTKAFIAIFVTISVMLLIMLCRYHIPIVAFDVLCVLCCIGLLLELCGLARLEDYGKRLFR